MRVIVIGAAAGGGFPQWNSNAPACRRARSGDPSAPRRTQTSVAVSMNSEDWFLLNASPDLAQQILQTPALHPRRGLRSSPISGVVLTGGDVDAIAGLLTLRERHAFRLCATRRLHEVIDANPIFGVLSPDLLIRETVVLDRPIPLLCHNGAESGLTLELFAVPGKTPLFLETQGVAPSIGLGEDTVGALLTGGGRTLAFVPACARVDPSLIARLATADALLFDGTLWSDDEMIRAGVGTKTGQRMGHISVSGPDGALSALERVRVPHKVFVHINNSNPILLDDSPERAQVEAAGWEVAHDGMELAL